MEDNFWTAFGASVIAAIVTAGGIYTIRHFEDWARRNITYFTCFAAGVLIAVSLLHLVPEAFAMNASAAPYLLAGYLLIYLFDRFLTFHVCDKPEMAGYALGLVALLGIGFHSFLDGVIYSISFSASMFTGFLVALGMILHEFPEGIVTYMLLIHGGVSRARSLVLAFLAAALTTPAGMLVSYPFISAIDTPFLGQMLALSAGALVYVGATHLLPHARHDRPMSGLVAFGTGIAIAAVVVLTRG